MNWKKKVFENFKLYAITDLKSEDPSILAKVEKAYRGGADIVQLRGKAVHDQALYRLGEKIKKIAVRNHGLFFINDRPDLALALKADGVHVGQDDMPIAVIRRLARRAGLPLWIGKSTHSLKQAEDAQREGADYIGVGPVFETPTKPMVRPVGLSLVRKVSQKIAIPFLAIGGIEINNLHTVLKAGARRIAVVRAIFGAENPYEAARTLCLKIKYSQ